MNEETPDNHRALNLRIKNYVMAEFVAVPSDFELKSHLSMREHVGLFEVKDIDIEKVDILSQAIANSAVFSTLNNALLPPDICFFYLQLLSELNLILKKIDNPLRRSQEEYKEFAKRWHQDRRNFFRGQEVERMSFLIVNVCHLFNQNIIDEAWKALIEVKKYQKEINEMNFKLD